MNNSEKIEFLSGPTSSDTAFAASGPSNSVFPLTRNRVLQGSL